MSDEETSLQTHPDTTGACGGNLKTFSCACAGVVLVVVGCLCFLLAALLPTAVCLVLGSTFTSIGLVWAFLGLTVWIRTVKYEKSVFTISGEAENTDTNGLLLQETDQVTEQSLPL